MTGKIGVFAGSFDPFTNGHMDIINEGLLLFDKIIIGILDNPDKSCMFEKSYRWHMICSLFKDNPKVEAFAFDGAAVDFIRMVKGDLFIRGYRNNKDLCYETGMRDYNYMHSGIDTVLIKCTEQNADVSSTMVRKLISEHEDFSGFVPEQIKYMIDAYLQDKN